MAGLLHSCATSTRCDVNSFQQFMPSIALLRSNRRTVPNVTIVPVVSSGSTSSDERKADGLETEGLEEACRQASPNH